MKNFIDITNRLKTELSISMDKDIAELLGISKFSFAEKNEILFLFINSRSLFYHTPN